ncbi:MAG TPA: type II toxin-antitoxin system prevent-host-death family antitoxin [Bryobacteraceae bacterium]|nr:type II toxin-antitoxin system prevent-host-death family antitoxin [Bryobacteraceae bacterium]
MIQENMLGAKTKLSQLVEAAERGEEVFIARNGVPVAKIVPVPQKRKKFELGFLKGEIAPPSDSQLFAMTDGEFEDFLDGRY